MLAQLSPAAAASRRGCRRSPASRSSHRLRRRPQCAAKTQRSQPPATSPQQEDARPGPCLPQRTDHSNVRHRTPHRSAKRSPPAFPADGAHPQHNHMGSGIPDYAKTDTGKNAGAVLLGVRTISPAAFAIVGALAAAWLRNRLPRHHADGVAKDAPASAPGFAGSIRRPSPFSGLRPVGVGRKLSDRISARDHLRMRSLALFSRSPSPPVDPASVAIMQ